MRHLSLGEVLEIYYKIMKVTGGSIGVRDLNGLKSALAQPRMTFESKELYPSVAKKAAALGFSLVLNHPFIDGNKRVGHAAMELFLMLNGFEIIAEIEEQERVLLDLASGELERGDFEAWVERNIREKDSGSEVNHSRT